MKPSSRKEVLINDVCSDGVCDVKPVSREEYWLVETLKRSGGGGGASSWNDLEDKPFEDNTVVYYEGNDYTGLEKVVDVADEICFYCKLSEKTPNLNELVGLCVESNVGHSFVVAEDSLVEEEGWIDVGGVFLVALDDVNLDGTALGRGIWVRLHDEDGFWITKVYKESIKKMDSKYVNLYTRLYGMGSNLFHDKACEHGVTKAELDKIISNGLVMVQDYEKYNWSLAVGYVNYPDEDYSSIDVMDDSVFKTFDTIEREGK